MAVAAVTEPGSGWSGSRLRRLNGSPRILGVDLARGLAVLGMLAAHLLVTTAFELSDPSSWLDVVNGRSSILFATLAGVSVGLVTGGPKPLRGEAMLTARVRLAVRAVLLWILGIGLILTGVPILVILPGYAVLFLLAIALTGLTARILFLIAGAVAVLAPWLVALVNQHPIWLTPSGELIADLTGWHYPFLLWVGFIAAGLGAARAGLRRLPVQLWLAGVGAALSVAGYGLDAALPAPEERLLSQVLTAQAHSSGVWEAIGSGGFALAVLGLCLLLCRSTVISLMLLPLRAVGTMPLTAYTAQVLVMVAVGVLVAGDAGDLMAIRAFGLFWPLMVALIVACTVWALSIGRGPLEWLIDRVTRLARPGTASRSAETRAADRLER